MSGMVSASSKTTSVGGGAPAGGGGGPRGASAPARTGWRSRRGSDWYRRDRPTPNPLPDPNPDPNPDPSPIPAPRPVPLGRSGPSSTLQPDLRSNTEARRGCPVPPLRFLARWFRRSLSSARGVGLGEEEKRGDDAHSTSPISCIPSLLHRRSHWSPSHSARGRVPDPRRVVPGPRCHPPPVRRPSHAEDTPSPPS